MNLSFLYLILSALCDTVWYLCLAISKGITDWWVNTIGFFFLLLGIVTFKKALPGSSLSIAVVILQALTLVLTIFFDVIFFKTKIDFKIAFFMTLCILSILGLNYYSKTP